MTEGSPLYSATALLQRTGNALVVDYGKMRARLTLADGWFSRAQGKGWATGTTNRRMTTARRSITPPSAWDRICSGVGYHLDNLGRWLIVNAPAIGSTYAASL